jgi:hypothetical protein
MAVLRNYSITPTLAPADTRDTSHPAPSGTHCETLADPTTVGLYRRRDDRRWRLRNALLNPATSRNFRVRAALGYAVTAMRLGLTPRSWYSAGSRRRKKFSAATDRRHSTTTQRGRPSLCWRGTGLHLSHVPWHWPTLLGTSPRRMSNRVKPGPTRHKKPMPRRRIWRAPGDSQYRADTGQCAKPARSRHCSAELAFAWTAVEYE